MSVVYSATVLDGVNKVGKLKSDENGYFPMTLGAFDMSNRSGIHYDMTDHVKNLFDQSSALMRRIRNGALRSELGHPQPRPGESMNSPAFLRRSRQINPRNCINHIKSAILVPGKDHKGNDIIRVEGMIKPSGVHHLMLIEQLKNPDEDVAYSVRSLANQMFKNGQYHRQIEEIITWDYENEAGIKVASKYLTPACEGIEDDFSFEVTPDLLDAAEYVDPNSPVALECDVLDTTMIRTRLGWEKVQTVNLSSLAW